MKILLIGKNGQVGYELHGLLPALGEVIALGHQELDLASPDSIRTTLNELRPQLIVNAAAYTDVNKAESEERIAHAINSEGPAILADEARKLGAALLHYSTDYVFDGTKHTPYVETDATHPLNAYGRTKLAGEKAISDSGAAYLILRTGWVYGTRGKNFLLTIVRAATQRERLEVVSDQAGSPTWSRMIASGTVQILSKLSDHSQLNDSGGLYHFTAAGETNWYEFARAILGRCDVSSQPGRWFGEATQGHPVIARSVVPIISAAYPSPAVRPAYSVLSNQKLFHTFGVKLPDWAWQLQTAMASAPSSGTDPRNVVG